MKALVGVKRVIDYAVKVRVSSDKSGVETKNVKHSINPFCEIAVEEAVRLKEKNIIKEVVAFSMGPKQSSETLRNALALGADKAIHIQLEDSELQLNQPIVVARVIQALLKKENYDMVLLGKQAIDGDFNQTGQLLAGLMNWPQGTFASKVEVNDKNCAVTREIDGGLQTVSFQLPGVITCDLRLNTPRFAKLPNIMKAKKKPLETLKLSDLGVDTGCNIQVIKVEEPEKRQGGVKVENVDELINKLKNEAKVF
ncbi:hypothetical protein PPERSA_03093 [Pseudocohnilembus persalinus]|uniref:Electron transfer flavoprotein subunit beta n=1 Tax=Pseudocohnilembus persalinus TaxID=266149 RepID=A0A0V0R8P3_PSEPJ|nr:hypothetical protein PPERSA_03093 [Pseudocohnilembus persalinus]|eukprot:KRX10876.1 hypothetical protein PPERSA_03093 [Pseudocohnilembus persalinus]